MDGGRLHRLPPCLSTLFGGRCPFGFHVHDNHPLHLASLRVPTPMQRVCVFLLSISLVVLFGTLMAHAQVETESSATSAPSLESAPEPRSNTDGIAPRTLGFKRVDRDGVVRFIPLEELGLKGITFEQYLKLLPDVRRYQITSLELAGTADEKNVKLTATLRINIDEEFGDQWVRVPVEMAEATLTSAAAYSGPGKARFDGQLARATGRRAWLIRGSGNHTLTLPLIRPLRQQEHTRRRLVLTLPAAGSSHVRLRLPGLDFRVDTSAQSGADVSHDSGNTFVNAYGLGVDFKLNWERKPRTSVSRLQLANRTEFLADLSKTPIKLSAKQTITAQQGSFEQLRVTLPKGIRVFDISELRDTAADQLLKDYTFAEAGDATTVTIYLTRPCSETIRLNWDLDPVLQKVPGKITFESFHVAGANVHTGEVEVIAPAGFEIERLDFLDARRTTVKTTLANNQIATAYQFTSDRFRLVLDIREIKPRFRIDPRVNVSADRAAPVLVNRLKRLVPIGLRRDRVVDDVAGLDPVLVENPLGSVDRAHRRDRGLIPIVGLAPVELLFSVRDHEQDRLLADRKPGQAGGRDLPHKR
jgi:hypothetical protein